VSIHNLAVLLLAVALAACAQVVLRHGMMRSAASTKERGNSLAVNAMGSGWIWLGTGPFGISALAWLLTLSRVPLSIA